MVILAHVIEEFSLTNNLFKNIKGSTEKVHM